MHYRFKDIGNPFPALGADPDGIFRRDADDVLDFQGDPFGLDLRQIHLVQHRHYLDTLLDGRITVGHGLCFHALRGIHHQQRAFASRQRPRDFVGKVDVSGSIDQVQLVSLPIAGEIAQ